MKVYVVVEEEEPEEPGSQIARIGFTKKQVEYMGNHVVACVGAVERLFGTKLKPGNVYRASLVGRIIE